MRAVTILLALAIAGCSGQAPNVVLAVPGGTVPLSSPAMPGGSVGPPPGLAPAPAMTVPTGDRNGSYAGTAQPLDTGGGLCLRTSRVTNFHVHGNAVRFGGFRGTIDSEGGVQMVYGTQWITGQFEGATFHGEYEIPPRFTSMGCSYVLNLTRVGP